MTRFFFTRIKSVVLTLVLCCTVCIAPSISHAFHVPITRYVPVEWISKYEVVILDIYTGEYYVCLVLPDEYSCINVDEILPPE